MGGKRKQAQRTKNNTRPSSSGRSAELLGTALPPFVGFSSVKESAIVSTGFSLPSDDIDTLVDSNFQLVFKKMNKKDSTTKLKALQEFTDLVKASEVEAIKAILPFWPRLYCALVIDSEHKVREATQLAHHQLVLKVRRNIAPYLKQLIGTWFVSQYDTYAPAASAASKAFEDCFPLNKAQEAIVFCQEEILNYICDNLTTQVPPTTSNTKVVPSEDSEAKYQRVVISSLNSYALYLNKVDTVHIEKYIELNLKIISNPKFWKLGKNKNPPVRSAWFAVLTMICQKAPFLMEKEAAHIVGFVFANLDENEPTVLPSVWEAALSILSLMNEWWNYVNIDKLFVPKLNKLLKDGGNGNASVIYPNLLPVLSHLPSIIDVNSFYPLFFENMRIGLKTKSVLGSRSESQAVSVAFIECLQYIIMKNQTDVGLCEKLIKIQLFPLLEWSFNDTQACYKSLYNQVAKLIQFWDRNVKDYGKYFDYFWHNLESLYLGLLLNLTQSCEVTPSQLATRQIELISSLKHATKSKQLLKVSFNSQETLLTKKEDALSNFSESYWHALNQLVYKTCDAYVNLINEKQSKDLIEHLVCLMHNFDSYTLFQQFGSKSNFCDIYRELLVIWLYDDVLCSKAVVDLVFLLFKYFSDDEKTEVLGSFCKNLNEECFGWCIAQTLSHPHCEDPIVLKWLRSETVRAFLVTIAEKEVNCDSNSELNLVLKQAFSEKDESDLMISAEAAMDIIKVFTRPLLDPLAYSTRLDICSSFAAYISTAIYTPHFKLKYGDDLLLALFTLSNSIVSDEILSTDTYWEVNTGWQDVIVVLSQETPYEEFKKVAQKCIGVILKSHTEKSLDLIINFTQIVAKHSPLWLKDILFLFFKHDFIDTWHSDICNMCERAEYLRGRLCIEHKPFSESQKIDENNIQKYFEWMDLIISVLSKSLEDGSKEFFDHVVDLLQHECSVFILDLFSTLTLGRILRQHYSCTVSGQNIKDVLTAFEKKLRILIANLNQDYIHSIETLLFKQIATGDWLWINCLFDFYIQTEMDNITTIKNLINQIINTPKRVLLTHTVQVWAKHITYDQTWATLTPLETISTLRSVIFQPDLEIRVTQTFVFIDAIRRKDPNDFILTSNLESEKILLIVEVIRFFAGVLQYQSECVQQSRWDLILTSFVTWCGNTTKLLNNEILTKSIIVALSGLFDCITTYIQNCGNEDIAREWDEVFAQDVHSNFVQMWCYYTDLYQKQPDKCLITDIPFLQDFGKSIDNFDTKYIFSKNCSIEWSKLLQQACSSLTHPVMSLQLWGYHMLMKLITGLEEIDANAVSTNTPNANGLIIERFKTCLLTTQEVVQSMLLEFRLAEDSCRVQPFTDSYTYTLAYLLLWDILISLCEQSSAELRYQYSDWFRRQNFVHCLLMNLFKLMPLEVEAKTKPFSDWFVTKCSVPFTEEPTSQLIEKLVCWIYTHALTQLPVLVRQWWCNQDTRVSQLVERITSTFVSSHLCVQELADLMKHVHKFKNMTIKTHPTVREVVAIYTVDEVQMELIITLPHNYPLIGPDVHCNKQILGTSQRLWLMQLKMCVLHQDGRIWDGLLLWNNNLDKRFDGVEECYICFAVIHQGTYQIPKLTCQTCKKKFHSACLYKWFSTSNKSSCPVCRNLF